MLLEGYTLENNIERIHLETLLVTDDHRVRQVGAGGWSWSGVREKHCYLTGSWRLELEGYERDSL